MVSGGSSGIGKATAIRLAKEGAAVAILARNEPAGVATAEEINQAGGAASFHAADISDPTQVDAAIDAILARYGKLDIAFNNAGSSGGVEPFHEVSFAAFDQVMRTNIYGLYYCMSRQIAHFLQRQANGAIVNCSSVSGLVGVPYQSAYCASKHAVIGLTKSVAIEYAAKGIRINAICPGGVATPMLKDYMRQLAKTPQPDALTPPPIGRGAAPAEVANLVAWLCSDEASYVVGQAYAVDGGFTTR